MTNGPFLSFVFTTSLGFHASFLVNTMILYDLLHLRMRIKLAVLAPLLQTKLCDIALRCTGKQSETEVSAR